MRKRIPEDDAQLTLHVADLPGDSNVGLEEMMRGLGLYSPDNNDPHHSSPHSPPPPTEADPSQNTGDAPPEGYKALDVRIEWAGTSLPSSSTHSYICLCTPFDPMKQTLDLVRSFTANASLQPTQTQTYETILPKRGSPLTASLPNLRAAHKHQISSAHAKNGESSRLPLSRANMMKTTPLQWQRQYHLRLKRLTSRTWKLRQDQ